MRRFAIPILLILAAGTATLSANAQDIYTPRSGSPERKQILDAIRPILEVRVGKPVEFVIGWFKRYDDWAFVSVDPQRPGGGRINPDDPRFKAWEDQDGLMTIVLLKHDYGRWNIVDFAIGPTDVFWDGDPLYKQFPRAFTYPSGE